MNTIEWSTKAARQLRKINDRIKRQKIFAEVQQLANWPDCQGKSSDCRGATITGFE
jgi:mRNA-degrading endonuclease RelE of RelBE toxin-antitoxin system